MIAEHPVAHKEGHYRCSLPDLAGFMILCCTGPGYQTRISIWTKKSEDFGQHQKTSSFIVEFVFIPAPAPVVKKFYIQAERDAEKGVLRQHPF